MDDPNKQQGFRTFIGVDLPETLKEVIAGLVRELNVKQLKLVEKENLHVTMLFLGSINIDKVDYVKGLLSRINYKRFKIAVEGLGVFSPKRPRVLFADITEGSDELRSIYNELYNDLKANGFVLEDRPYTPHITLARIKWLDAGSRNSLLEFIDTHKERFGEFYCETLSLKQSTLTEKGPIYRNIFVKKLLL